MNLPYKPVYPVEDEREAIRSLSGIRSFLMKGRVFTDRVNAEGVTVEDIMLSELAAAADLVAPFEENLRHAHGDRVHYVRRNIRTLNFEEVLSTLHAKTMQSHDELAMRVSSILKYGPVADIFSDIKDKYNSLATSKVDSVRDIENLAHYLSEASRDIHTGISQPLRFLEDRYQRLKSLLERGRAFYEAVENSGGLLHAEQPHKNWALTVTHKFSKLGASLPFLKHESETNRANPPRK